MFGIGARQADPISAVLFILALEILFHLVRSKTETKGLAVFDNCSPYSAYADDTTFFLQTTISVKHMVDTFFSYFSGLKPNLTKSKIAGTGVLKGVQVAVCGMR